MKSKAFTLVELIIVVVIIGILATVSIVGYSNQSDKAMRNSVYANMTDSIRAANACVVSGGTVNAVKPAGATEIQDICNPASEVTGRWPDIRNNTNNNYRYGTGYNISISQTQSVTVSDKSNMLILSCNLSGCVKNGW